MTADAKPILDQRLAASNRRPWVWFALIALLLAAQIKPWWTPGDDATQYLSVARHMAHGRLQRFDSPHVRIAPGYPAVIAPAFWVSDRPFLTISLIHLGLSLSLAGAVFIWFRRIAPHAAPMLTALVMVNVGFWHVYRQALSETAFMMWLMWAACAMQRLIDARSSRSTIGWVIASSLLIIAAAYTRQVGAFAVGGLGLALLIRALRGRVSWTRAIAIGVAVSVIVFGAVYGLVEWDNAMQARSKDTLPYSEHIVPEGSSLTEQLIEGVRLRTAEIGRLTIPGMYKASASRGQWLHINTLVYGLISVAVFYGWWRLVKDDHDPLLLTWPIYFAFFIVWPYDQSTRYTVPLLAVLIACVWALLRPLSKHRFGIIAALITLHIIVSLVYWVRSLDERHISDHWPVAEAAAAVLEADPAPTAMLDVEHEMKNLYLMTSFEVDRIIAYCQTPQEISPKIRWLLTPAADEVPDGFVLRNDFGPMRLLERTAPGE